MMRYLNALFVPVLILVFTGMYVLHVKNASAAAIRVPFIIAICTTTMAVLVAWIELRGVRNEKKGSISLKSSLFIWMKSNYKEIFYLFLGISYYFSFITLGFTASNFIYIFILIYILSIGENLYKMSLIKNFVFSALFALFFHILAIVMDFNVPSGFLFS